MDLATLVGLVGGIAIILAAILTKGSLVMFADPGSLFIVAGGTLAATLIRFPLKTVFGAFKVALITFKIFHDLHHGIHSAVFNIPLVSCCFCFAFRD